MNSIKRKLFMQLGGLILLLVSLLIIANSMFLEPFYVASIKNELITIYSTIDGMAESDYENQINGLPSIEAKTRFDIAIGTEFGEVIYTTNPQINRLRSVDDPKSTSWFRQKGPTFDIDRREVISHESTLYWVTDTMNGMRSMILEGNLSNGYQVMLHFPIASIQGNITIVNQFLLIIGAFIFLLSLFVAYSISKSFAEPIMTMNHVTKKMKQLSFEEKCTVTTSDEIGQLAESINELSDSLSESLQELKEKNSALAFEVEENHTLARKRKVLLSNVSHELKTPLSLMQGYAEGLLVLGKENPEKVDHYAHIIMDESHKMNDLIERLLSIDQIETGNLQVNWQTFSLHELVDEQLKSLDELSKKHAINFEKQYDNPTMVHGDRMLIAQAISNLITNAIHHHSDNLPVSISCRDLGDEIVFAIKNAATTLTESELKSLWDSFYKLDKARTRHKGGHGLGLSFVKSIMEAHKNEYSVRQEGNMIIFSLYFKKGNHL